VKSAAAEYRRGAHVAIEGPADGAPLRAERAVEVEGAMHLEPAVGERVLPQDPIADAGVEHQHRRIPPLHRGPRRREDTHLVRWVEVIEQKVIVIPPTHDLRLAI